jgi:hypothetical protein
MATPQTEPKKTQRIMKYKIGGQNKKNPQFMKRKVSAQNQK